MKDPPGTTRAALLFLRLRIFRLRNRWSAVLRRKGKTSSRRAATPGKRPVGSVLSVLLGLLLLSSYLMLAWQMVSNLERTLDVEVEQNFQLGQLRSQFQSVTGLGFSGGGAVA